ncbi:hypothetical protein AGABI1DRAFT_123505 [Agaricus bisporus var. burnettii JB137-S8]|uniref:Major facilitator superfamily (MFS) profile domain-containing protein n=1 Tax=Agaricus bisporus var. burnettii (strain JB137-S8 / ATCC MYA-4627 / FGSC 10392) TaxID=597362 RepID=K5WW91_AGABU|nr:uncharacterized protein AGABI1DRAFT_123505 [Agaricus bisporus var. burnettii JB137-S8]EKM74837.1 hypothetical protein AGABI1DRAFT_123505 [Agaricus bisporus var. burnettii JB137-S8]
MQPPADDGDRLSATSIDPEELRIPKKSSLSIIVICNCLLQVSFFIIVSSSNDYAKRLGGDSTFSGIVIGIPTAISALALIPIIRYDKGGYTRPLNISCASMILGHILYACAYQTSWLYLILIGRIINGFGFTMWMYCKRYCSDARIVGIRRRTTLASFLVVGQGLGMSLGPFAGGLLYKVGFRNTVFNGFTSPSWVMAAVWCCFWVCTRLFFVDVPKDARYTSQPPSQPLTESTPTTNTPSPDDDKEKTSDPTTKDTIPIYPPPPTTTTPTPKYKMSLTQIGVLSCMCWFAMTCFFILGAWEANLPVFGSTTPQFHWSPTASGNFIALGGISCFPFLILNIFLTRRISDRLTLLFGASLGLSASLVFLSLLRTSKLNYGSVFMCWWGVALGFNIASTTPVSLLSKQLPPEWNGWVSLAIQYSMYTGRVTGAIWGGSGVKVGMMNYIGLQIGLVGLGLVMLMILWDGLKAKRG